MKIILSAHFDLAKPVKYVHVDKNAMHGLVDNFAGVFVAYEAARKTNTEIYLTNFEEVDLAGAAAVAKELRGEDAVVIVVDTCTDAEDKKAYIGNAYFIDTDRLKKKFSKQILFKDGYYEPTEDETAEYGWESKIPSFFFGIPIHGPYHAPDNKIALKTMDEATKLLIKVINFAKKKNLVSTKTSK